MQQRKNEPFKPFYVEGSFESEQERLENHEVIEYYEIGKNANKNLIGKNSTRSVQK